MIDAVNLSVLGTKKSSLSGKKAAWVEDIKISPDSTKVAFGTHGGVSKVEVITLDSQGKPGKIDKLKIIFSSALIAVDWSIDSQKVMANSQAGELYWASVASKETINASSMKDEQFATTNCRFGFGV